LFFPKENRRDFPEEISVFQDKPIPGFFLCTIEKNRAQRYTVRENCLQRYPEKEN
jgi:hypothetical protein